MAAHARDVNILIWTAVSRSVIKQMIASWSVAREPWAGGCCLPATRRRGPSQRNRAVKRPPSRGDNGLDQQHPRTTLRATKKATPFGKKGASYCNTAFCNFGGMGN